ncbi:MAG: hypothetical protein H8D61_01125 [Deltaproteobacteria bacterium]|nr:hypothetical protein [Deltaproteobacteria bacterium]
MKEKIPISGTEWEANLAKALALIKKSQTFLFAGDLDGDSVGSMVALALYFRLLFKETHIVLAEGLGDNLDFLQKIINFNSLPALSSSEDIIAIRDHIDTVVFFDTANTKLVPLYSTIKEHILLKKRPVIEIDHHFGADSEEMTEYGIKLFRLANANTEIIAEILSLLSSEYPDLSDPFSQRNILVALITGISWDTLGGHVVPYKEDYQHWITRLGTGLEDATWTSGAAEPAETRKQKFGQPEDVIEYMNYLDAEKKGCIDSITARIRIDHGIASLNLLNSTYSEVQDDCRDYGSDWFDELRTFLLNIVPEKAGKIGIVYYEGQNTEGIDCIFIKMRRAIGYKDFDLRQLEDDVRNVFSEENYMGGGGHPGAVSFRIDHMPDPEFQSGLAKILLSLKKAVS